MEDTSTNLKLETCSNFIPSTQIYKLFRDGIRDMSSGFLMYFLGTYDKQDTFSDTDIWGVGNKQWDYSHLSLFKASWGFGTVSSQRSHFTSYIFLCRAPINFQTCAAGHFLHLVLGFSSDLLYLTVRAQFLPLHLILQCWKNIEITVGEVWTVGRAFCRRSTKVR